MALLARPAFELTRRSRALLSLLGVVALVAPPLALLSSRIPPPLVGLVLAASWAALYALTPRILGSLVSRAARAVWGLEGGGAPGEPPEPQGAPEVLEDLAGIAEEPPAPGLHAQMDIGDAALLAWGLASGLAREIAGGRVRVYVAVHDDGLIYYVYPENYGEEVYQVAEEDFDEEIAVARAGDGTLLVILSEDTLATLYEAASRGDGERIVAESEEEARLIYTIAREIARAHLKGAPQAYVDYVAYKAIVKMALKGQLDAPQNLLDSVLDVDVDTRYRIKRQIDEELHYHNMSSTGAKS
ncbi:MAG: hypothetical protein LRS49_04800 [Desulfurococcales archaeon]|nr:hypothetical protein [Desulfurococcales archaeon]